MNIKLALSVLVAVVVVVFGGVTLNHTVSSFTERLDNAQQSVTVAQ